MNRDELHILLIEYAEGTLDADKKIFLEEKLKTSPELRIELQLLSDTFSQLQLDEDATVPSHYFSNFLPRLRKRLDQNEGTRITFLPRWVYQAIPAAVVILLLAVGIGIYYSLEPAHSPRQMYEAVQEMDDADIEELLDFYADDAFEDAFLKSDFVGNNLTYKVLDATSVDESIVNDGQLIFNLTDDEIDMIVKKLNANAVQ